MQQAEGGRGGRGRGRGKRSATDAAGQQARGGRGRTGGVPSLLLGADTMLAPGRFPPAPTAARRAPAATRGSSGVDEEWEDDFFDYGEEIRGDHIVPAARGAQLTAAQEQELQRFRDNMLIQQGARQHLAAQQPLVAQPWEAQQAPAAPAATEPAALALAAQMNQQMADMATMVRGALGAVQGASMARLAQDLTVPGVKAMVEINSKIHAAVERNDLGEERQDSKKHAANEHLVE